MAGPGGRPHHALGATARRVGVRCLPGLAAALLVLPVPPASAQQDAPPIARLIPNDQGKLLAKRNTFTDFIAVAETLEQQRYTSRDRLAIEGYSAGGLLIGSVVNMRPDLFGAAVMGVPFVDVINTMLDASIPLTAQERKQWGNPTTPRTIATCAPTRPTTTSGRRSIRRSW